MSECICGCGSKPVKKEEEHKEKQGCCGGNGQGCCCSCNNEENVFLGAKCLLDDPEENTNGSK